MTEHTYEQGGTTSADMTQPFVAVPIWMIERDDIGPRAKWLYVILCRYASMRDGARPKRKTMAELMGYSRPDSVDAPLRELIDANVVRVLPRFGKSGERLENHYEIVMWGPLTPQPPNEGEGGRQTTAGGDAKTVEAHPSKPSSNSKNNLSKNKLSKNVSSADVVVPDAVDDDRDDVVDLLDLLDDEIRANGNDAPSRTKRNRDAMRLLLDRDGYTIEQVAWIIRWSQAHEFWRTNILSASKLRKQFVQLIAQSREQHRKMSATTATQRQSGWDDAADRLRAMGVQ